MILINFLCFLQCQFVANKEDNDQVTCSLGYLPFLPNVSRYCTLNEQWGVNQSLPPTKHNVLCQARGAHSVITSHDDFLNRVSIATAPGANVTLSVVKEPTTKYVLVLESSSSMIKQDLWKWISKAAQKFIRNDLMTNTKVLVIRIFITIVLRFYQNLPRKFRLM